MKGGRFVVFPRGIETLGQSFWTSIKPDPAELLPACRGMDICTDKFTERGGEAGLAWKIRARNGGAITTGILGNGQTCPY